MIYRCLEKRNILTSIGQKTYSMLTFIIAELKGGMERKDLLLCKVEACPE